MLIITSSTSSSTHVKMGWGWPPICRASTPIKGWGWPPICRASTPIKGWGWPPICRASTPITLACHQTRRVSRGSRRRPDLPRLTLLACVGSTGSVPSDQTGATSRRDFFRRYFLPRFLKERYTHRISMVQY
jgi:hypothetical protein